MPRLFALALLSLAACGSASEPTQLSPDNPAGSYRLTAVNLARLPVFISIQPFPFVQLEWSSGTLVLAGGKWTEELLVHVQTADADSLVPRRSAGSYARVGDHLEFTPDPASSSAFDSVQVARFSGSQLIVTAGIADVFTFTHQ